VAIKECATSEMVGRVTLSKNWVRLGMPVSLLGLFLIDRRGGGCKYNENQCNAQAQLLVDWRNIFLTIVVCAALDQEKPEENDKVCTSPQRGTSGIDNSASPA
jgi:hypothetical protein